MAVIQLQEKSDMSQTSSPLQLKVKVIPHHRSLSFFVDVMLLKHDPRSSSCVPSSHVLLKF